MSSYVRVRVCVLGGRGYIQPPPRDLAVGLGLSAEGQAGEVIREIL